MPDSKPFQSYRDRIESRKGASGTVPPNTGGGTGGGGGNGGHNGTTPTPVVPVETPPAIDPSGIVNPPIWQDTPHAMTGYTGTTAEPLATQQLLALINSRANSQWANIPKATYTPFTGNTQQPATPQPTMYDNLVSQQEANNTTPTGGNGTWLTPTSDGWLKYEDEAGTIWHYNEALKQWKQSGSNYHPGVVPAGFG